MSGEAVAGKNPVSHVGKIYNVLADDLARRIHERIADVEEASVTLCSRIGDPLDAPAIAAVDVCLAKGGTMRDVEPEAARIVEEGLENVGRLVDQLARGERRLFGA